MSTAPVLDMELRKKDAEALTVPQPQAMDLATVLQGLALNPDVPVDKLEKIIALHERVQATAAKAAFDAAFAVMQAELPVIVEYKKGDGGKWSYAPLEDIVQAVRPTLAKHGFALSHATEWPDKGTVKVIGILSHKQGHERRSEFLSAADNSGSKNAVQALGSATSYGRRYTTNDLLNIVTRGEDDDAKRTARLGGPQAPSGYSEWLDTLALKANEGLPALQKMWTVANEDADLKAFAAHLTKTEPETWNELKKRAARAVAK